MDLWISFFRDFSPSFAGRCLLCCHDGLVGKLVERFMIWCHVGGFVVRVWFGHRFFAFICRLLGIFQIFQIWCLGSFVRFWRSVWLRSRQKCSRGWYVDSEAGSEGFSSLLSYDLTSDRDSALTSSESFRYFYAAEPALVARTSPAPTGPASCLPLRLICSYRQQAWAYASSCSSSVPIL